MPPRKPRPTRSRASSRRTRPPPSPGSQPWPTRSDLRPRTWRADSRVTRGRAADTLEKATHAIESRDLDALLAEGQDYARRQPMVFLGASFAAGFALARLLKASSTRGGYESRPREPLSARKNAGAATEMAMAVPGTPPAAAARARPGTATWVTSLTGGRHELRDPVRSGGVGVRSLDRRAVPAALARHRNPAAAGVRARAHRGSPEGEPGGDRGGRARERRARGLCRLPDPAAGVGRVAWRECSPRPPSPHSSSGA